MKKLPTPEQQGEGQRWSIYEGEYNATTNPVDPEVIKFIISETQEPYYSEETRRRVVMGNTAMYALLLCNFGLAANDEIRVSTQKEIGAGLMRLGRSFSETDSRAKTEVDELGLEEPPVFAALSDMEAKRLVNSYEIRLLQSVFRLIMVAEKRAYDQRVIESAFGVIMSAKKNPAESTD